MSLTPHLALLRAAATRQDHLLPRPETLSSKEARTLFTSLQSAGYAELAAVTPDQPCWRREKGQPVGLRLTPAGLEVLEHETQHRPAAAAARMPRVTKQARVLGLLNRPEGATLDEMMQATGWLAHSTRALLTGLRKKGHALVPLGL